MTRSALFNLLVHFSFYMYMPVKTFYSIYYICMRHTRLLATAHTWENEMTRIVGERAEWARHYPGLL